MSSDSDTDDRFGHLFKGERGQLEDIFGDDWRDCVTPHGANVLLSTLAKQQAEQPEPIEDGDECPVCGDPIRNVYDVMDGFEGDTLEAEKVCVVEFPDHSIVHFDDDRLEDI